MNIFGFNIMSKEEKAKAADEYNRIIFPLGKEEHKAKVLSVLHEVCTGKYRDEELLFVFITSKDKYLDESNSLDGLKIVMKINKDQRWISEDNLRMVVTLVYLESDITSLENYPTAEAVKVASQQYPITEYFK
jgi:hypothetical protein